MQEFVVFFLNKDFNTENNRFFTIFAPMKMKFFVIGSLLLLALAACHSLRREAEPCPQADLLYQLEFYSAAKPDSVMQILDTLNVDMLSEKERAHYCLVKVGVRDMFFLYDDVTDSLLQVAEDHFIGGKDKNSSNTTPAYIIPKSSSISTKSGISIWFQTNGTQEFTSACTNPTKPWDTPRRL